jgi:hypothetical protein
MCEWSYSSTILDLGTRCRWMVSFTPGPIYSRRRAPSIHFRGGWVESRGGLDFVQYRKTSWSYREKNQGRPSRSLSLNRFPYAQNRTLFQMKFTVNTTTNICHILSVSGNASDLHLGGVRFESRLGHWLLCLLVVILSPFRQIFRDST